jgi:hypothetical protein
MEKIATLEQLKAAILILEAKERDCRLELAYEIKKSVENFSPENFIKRKLSELVSGSNIKSLLITSAVKLATGYISKKFSNHENSHPVKRMMGFFLQIGAPNIVFNKNQVFVDELSPDESA